MGFGRTTPEGSLPFHSVDTEYQAYVLLKATCKSDVNGELYAPELAEEQTLDNLAALGARVRAAEERLIAAGHPAWRKP